jgi:hypothetical protein
MGKSVDIKKFFTRMVVETTQQKVYIKHVSHCMPIIQNDDYEE